MDSDSTSHVNFTRRYLPWAVAAVALLLYFLTLGHGLTNLGLSSVVRATGWAWQPVLTGPVQFILTYPIQWLPPGAQVLALNALGAIFAALTLALLARSVTLLPHDRTRDQRQFERSEDGLLSIRFAWVPPVLAVLVCAMQRTFWEHAVIGTGEMLDLLLLAYVIRSVLEYRVDQRDSWLYRAALVYGLGMTNNYAMIAFLPAFVGAVIWIKGRSFFNVRFCVRMALLGFAGLLLYLLIPLVQLSNKTVDLDFIQTLRLNLAFQKNMLLKFPRFLLLIFGLSSLAPVLFMGIKWPASFGDISTVGNALTNLMTHVIHALFLAAAVYVSFDPEISPRTMAGPMGYSMLSFYYLGALSIGYFSGYFLLVFGSNMPLRAWQRPSFPRLVLNRSIVAVVLIGLVAVPAGLVYKNFPQVRATAGNHLDQYGAEVVRELQASAPNGALVIGDDPYRLYATYGSLKRRGLEQAYPVIDTTSLAYPVYLRYLNRKYPKYWPEIATNVPPNAVIEPLMLVQLMSHLSQTNTLFYLHPSFGYYFERFYGEPQNLLWRLKAYTTNMVDSPVLTEAQIQQNDQFWKEYQGSQLKELPGTLKSFMQRKQPNEAMVTSGAFYSRALTYFGAELQEAGKLEKAGEYFAAALELNPENPAAFLNREYNKHLREGRGQKWAASDAAQRKMTRYEDNIDAVLTYHGPIDEPSYCFKAAEAFARGRNARQAAQYLRRTLVFEPTNLVARVGLVSMYNQIQQFELARELIRDIRTKSGASLPPVVQLELTQAEATTYLGRDNLAECVRILEGAQKTFPTNVEPYAMLVEVYLQRGDVTNAFKVLDSQLKAQPEQTGALVNYARIKILSKQFADAIPYLDRALKVQSRDPFALINRAIANLKVGNLTAAESDYTAVHNLLPKPTFPVLYGLHEVAWLKKDRKQATKWGKEFLKLAPVNSPDVKVIKDRLEQIKAGVI